MDIFEKRLTILKALIGENSLKDFAAAHDVDASYLSQLLNGHRRVGDRAASNLEEKLNLPSGLLVTGAYDSDDRDILFMMWHSLGLKRHNLPHPAFFNAKINETAEKNEAERQALARRTQRDKPVPVVGKAMLGPNGHFEAMDYPTGHGDGYLDIHSDDKNAYGLKVIGNSMHPRIKNGEFVLVEPGHPYLSGDEVLVQTRDGQSMIKEFIYCRDGQYRFDSVNDGFPPLVLSEEEVAKVHYVAGILKSSRYVDIT